MDERFFWIWWWKNPWNNFKINGNHEENENWFSSLIGFFYEYGLGDTNIIDKNKSLEFYSLSINKSDKNKKLTSLYQLLNIIIAKYLLSLYYYKDTILYKRNFIAKEYSKNVHVMSHSNQFENFYGLELSISTDETNSIEKYFELLK